MPDNIYNNPNPTEGPWPECKNWSGIACAAYIDAWTGYSIANQQNGLRSRIRILDMGINDFKYNRVWIQCDNFGKVLQAPKRG